MTGIPNHNKEAFLQLEKDVTETLKSEYPNVTYEIINPSKLDLDFENPSWEDYMKNDIAKLMKCNCIVMMKGWENSRGAPIERALAKEFGMQILDEDLNSLQTPKKENKSILDEAEELTNGARQSAYGHPSENFKNIADGWNWYIDMKYKTDSKLTPEDVALMMTLLKVARETHSVKRDNIVDAAGYLNTYQMCIDMKNGIGNFEDSKVWDRESVLRLMADTKAITDKFKDLK
jgi:hypothetical protein